MNDLSISDTELLDFLMKPENVGYSLVSDDNGNWACSGTGSAPVCTTDSFTETVVVTHIVDPTEWYPCPRQAIKAVMLENLYG